MMIMFPGMLAIVVTWAVLAAICYSIGWAILRVAGARPEQAENRFGALWVGWAAMIAGLQLWQLFWPVGIVVLWVFTVAGIICAVAGFVRRPPFCKTATVVVPLTHCWPHGKKLLRGFGYLVVMMVFAVWLANRAMGPLYQPYDTGLYHLNAIRWLTDFPAVPGLGNLHTRFATMPSYFLYMGLLDAFPGMFHPWNIAHGLLLLFAMCQILWSGAKCLRPRHLHPHDMLAVMFFPVVLRSCLLEASSTASDLPVFLLGFIVCLHMARTFARGKSVDWRAIGVIVLSAGAAATTIRLGMAVLVLSAGGVLLLWKYAEGRQEWPMILAWLVLPVLLIGGWIIRNIVFSGYPLPPSTLFGFSVEWRIPAAHLTYYTHVIMAWARDYRAPVEEVLSSWSWLWPWFKGVVGYYLIEVTIPLSIAVAAVLFALVGIWHHRSGAAIRLKISTGGPSASAAKGVHRQAAAWKQSVFLLPPIAMLIFWFFTAPDQRFAGATFWWLAAASGLWACSIWGGVHQRRCWMPVALVSLTLTGWFDLRLTKYTRPGPLAGGYYPVPEANVKTFVAESGLSVFVPVTGDQLWDSPLPASPYSNPKLRLRRTGDVSKGFSVIPDRTVNE